MEEATASCQILSWYSFLLLYVFFELMSISVWKVVKRGIGILHTIVSTHDGPIARHNWHLQFSLEK